MRRSKLQTLATEYADKQYPITENNCGKMKLNLIALQGEINDWNEKKNNPNCKNRLFSADDCKKEAEEYWKVLTERERTLRVKYSKMNCEAVARKQNEDAYYDDLNEELAGAESEFLASSGWKNLAVYGVGVSVVLLGTYLILKRKK